MRTLSRRNAVFLVLAVLFFMPGLAAYLLYTHPTWLGFTKTNKGHLLNPPLLLAPLQVTTKSSPKWRLVLWSPSTCAESCLSALDQLVRVRLALGRHYYEVDTVLLVGDTVPSKAKQRFFSAHQIQWAHLPAKTQLPVGSRLGGIFIVDPKGYLVLDYSVEVKPEDIFHDMKQLLTTVQTRN